MTFNSRRNFTKDKKCPLPQIARSPWPGLSGQLQTELRPLGSLDCSVDRTGETFQHSSHPSDHICPFPFPSCSSLLNVFSRDTLWARTSAAALGNSDNIPPGRSKILIYFWPAVSHPTQLSESSRAHTPWDTHWFHFASDIQATQYTFHLLLIHSL